MSVETKTDRQFSSASSEFVWDIDDDIEAHSYLFAPVEAELKHCGARQVLDLGCGNGAFAGHLNDAGYEVTGLDHSSSGIARARRNHPRLAFAQHDLMKPLAVEHMRKFDAVIAIEVIEHLMLPRQLMRAAVQALRPGGVFIVTTPYHGYLKNLALAITGAMDEHWHPLRDYGHVKFFSRRTLTLLFEEFGFIEIRFRTAGRIPALAKSMIVSGIQRQ